MALTYKHAFGSIDGTRVSIIEKGLSKDRLSFLKDLLELNGFTVKSEEVKPKDEDGEITYNLGVTDMVFNPVIWIYDRRLKTADGRYVTHEYWDQAKDITKPQYWEMRYN